MQCFSCVPNGKHPSAVARVAEQLRGDEAGVESDGAAGGAKGNIGNYFSEEREALHDATRRNRCRKLRQD